MNDAVNDNIMIGEWELEINAPYGFVARNRTGKTDFHFFHAAEGWITSVYDGKQLRVLCASGLGMGQPHLVDKENIKLMERTTELRQKGEDITLEEAKELLSLCGLIGGPK